MSAHALTVCRHVVLWLEVYVLHFQEGSSIAPVLSGILIKPSI